MFDIVVLNALNSKNFLKTWLVPSPDRIAGILNKYPIEIEEVNALLKNDEWYLNKNEIKNINILTKG